MKYQDRKEYLCMYHREKYATDEKYREMQKANFKKRYNDIMSDEEKHEIYKEKRRNYMREYNKRKKNKI